jgi:AcrR family transcriptional regulator
MPCELAARTQQCHTYDMSAVQRQFSELRDEYAALMRQRIVAAFAETPAQNPVDDVSMAALATSANFAERSVYQHFETGADLRSAGES